LALYYRLAGQDKEAHPLFRDRLKLRVSLLEDHDADNDYQAWEILARTFLKAGEKENTVAAISVWDFELRKQLEKLGADSEDDETEASDTESSAAEPEEEQSLETEVTKVPKDVPPPDVIETPVKRQKTKSILGLIRRLPKSSAPQMISVSVPATTEPVNSQPDIKPTLRPIRRLPKSSAPKTALASIPAPAEPVDPYPDTPWAIGVSDCCNKSLADNKTGIWVCLFCRDMSFCLDCFKKHQEGNLPYIMCDPDPEFVVCYGYPENLPQEKIKVGGKILGRGEWLDGIRTRWGFKGKEGEEGEEGEGEKVEGKVSWKEGVLEKIGIKS
jgi:hypothetical protein